MSQVYLLIQSIDIFVGENCVLGAQTKMTLKKVIRRFCMQLMRQVEVQLDDVVQQVLTLDLIFWERTLSLLGQSTDVQIIIESKAFKFVMSEDLVKLRGRLSSEAMTAAEQLPENDASFISFKPKEDPDAPPALELENDLELFSESQEPKIPDEKQSLELGSPRRLRAKSEDNQYTIIGFLEKKIRIRIMSQQFNSKLFIYNSQE